MKVTRYEHACLVLEDNNQKVVIDPGVYAESLPKLKDVSAIVVTHVHADHFDPRHIDRLLKDNPDALIFTTEEVSKELNTGRFKIVNDGDQVKAGPFSLSFYGELHAHVHDVWPQAQNIGVMINDYFYYPGDSFTIPDKHPKLVALPVGGPWQKTGEVMDYLAALKPAKVFPTHTVHVSEVGLGSIKDWLADFAKENGTEYINLGVGESLDF